MKLWFFHIFVKFRWLISGLGSALLFMIFYFYVDGNIFATHSLCPMAPVCTFFTFLRGEIFYFHGFLFFTVLVAFSLFVRRLFCFIFCPVGFVGDILFKIGRACRLPRISETNLFRSFSLYSRIFFLASALFIPLFTGCMIFQHACPFILIGDMMYGIVVPLAVSIFSVIVFLSLFISRFFCRFICPLGLIMGLTGRIGNRFLPTMTVDLTCKGGFSCGKCTEICPTGINIAKLHGKIDDIDCILCGQCVEICALNRKKNQKKNSHITADR